MGFSVAPASGSIGFSDSSVTFNSRYLGFSVAPSANCVGFNVVLYGLSIPVTWDFPLHQPKNEVLVIMEDSLSIPVTWDFPLHLSHFSGVLEELYLSFNSRYLGFSVAP